mmetsp:Transcript_60304/g.147992  ORF Transcript_60304/g.147992 Transcript_60304/m.147992 type:complete len:247 (+) Transcript_60304:57-797(+)
MVDDTAVAADTDTDTTTTSKKMSGIETIALFGATGKTGRYCLTQALGHGYKVRALVRDKSKLDASLFEVSNLTILQGDFSTDNKSSIEECLSGADYVIVMAGCTPPNEGGSGGGGGGSYPQNMMLDFFKLLTMTIDKMIGTSRTNVKVLLYQAGAFSVTQGQRLPIGMNILKVVVGDWMMGLGPMVNDNNDVIRYVAEQNHTWRFRAIVIRPAQIKDYDALQKDALVAERLVQLGFMILRRSHSKP